jgi:hypothetical protein
MHANLSKLNFGIFKLSRTKNKISLNEIYRQENNYRTGITKLSAQKYVFAKAGSAFL